jgi:hypothetical protein
MAYVIDDKQRFVPTWAEAVKYLQANGRQATNLVLEITKPTLVTDADQQVLAAVDQQLRQNSAAKPKDPDLTINTVAATIFPQGVYARHKPPQFYGKFKDLMKKGQKPHTWGTYAMRLMHRESSKGHILNPLENVVAKLHKATHGGKAVKSNYEVGMHTCYADADFDAGAAEVPVTDPFRDTRDRGIPCLSHLTFKLLDDKVHLTAIYRTHFYCQRALGNLKGLAQLLNFVAAESEIDIGTLTCISTLACLDLESWTSAKNGADFLKNI